MATYFPQFYIENPFAREEFSRDRKVVYALNQAGRLRALDADYFDAIIARLEREAEALSLASATTGSALSQQVGETDLVKAALQKLRDVISGKHGVLRDQLGKSSALLKTIFNKTLSDYTTSLTLTNYAKQTGKLLQNMQATKGVVKADVITAVQDAVKALDEARNKQTEQKSNVGTSRSTGTEADETLTATLFEAAGMVIQHYPGKSQLDKRRLAYDFNLLPAPQGGHSRLELAGFVPGGSSAALLSPVTPDPLVKIQLCNVGLVRLSFGLSVDGLTLAGAGTEVLPGAKLSTTLATLGDPMLEPVLLVVNNTSELGQYEVTVG
ncbi:hypothetical protein Q5H93_23910 [Hymenobacter sp. ASUV-10]|uniref:Tail fiber protein n=1 Tax=Hymenobacter aranciens TaxID=3063996 RepID=A0ABT9BHQ5_9BACT|nr:hypothetical protein [Hymenobacter sp. ASUV-10]MDO7877803.1 hypothetical protein [Hymenobacter sp. ASUV-10]